MEETKANINYHIEPRSVISSAHCSAVDLHLKKKNFFEKSNNLKRLEENQLLEQDNMRQRACLRCPAVLTRYCHSLSHFETCDLSFPQAGQRGKQSKGDNKLAKWHTSDCNSSQSLTVSATTHKPESFHQLLKHLQEPSPVVFYLIYHRAAWFE